MWHRQDYHISKILDNLNIYKYVIWYQTLFFNVNDIKLNQDLLIYNYLCKVKKIPKI